MANPQPILPTERLILKPFTLDDAPRVQLLAGPRAIADTTLAIPHPYPDGAAEKWIRTHPPLFAAGTHASFTIASRAEDSLVGAIGLVIEASHARAELPVVASSQATRRTNDGYHGFEAPSIARTLNACPM